MSFPHAHVVAAAGNEGTPLDYDDLLFFLDAENGITESSNDVSQWTDQSSNAFDFDLEGGDDDPIFQSSAQNSLPGINFSEDVGNSTLNKRLVADDAGLDDMWAGSGDKSLAFACRADKFDDDTFNTEGVLVEKGFRNSNGWLIITKSDGSLQFRHKRSNGSFWQISANGFYSAPALILGYVIYDGGNSSGSGTMFLHNGSTFVETGTVSTGSSSTIGADASRNLRLGNQDDNLSGFDAPFQGPIFGMWATKPASNTFDQAYLERWIP